jgi:hypothetical protein
MSENKTEYKSIIEVVSKLVASVALLIGSALIPWLLHLNSQENQKTQVYAQIMSKREQSDTQIRAEMFKTLIGGYINNEVLSQNKEEEKLEILRRNITLLALLIKNFQEYFDARPLFEDIYYKLQHLNNKESKELQQNLIDLAKDIAKRQATMLIEPHLESTKLNLRAGESKCIRLYDIDDTFDRESKYIDENITYCSDRNMKPFNNSKVKTFHSIEIYLNRIIDSISVQVEVILYDDFYTIDSLTKKLKYLSSLQKDQLTFNVSFFDMPYMDNTRLYNGKRFSLILSNIRGQNTILKVVEFREEFMSLRDRPYIEQIFNKIR